MQSRIFQLQVVLLLLCLSFRGARGGGHSIGRVLSAAALPAGARGCSPRGWKMSIGEGGHCTVADAQVEETLTFLGSMSQRGHQRGPQMRC